MVTRRTSDLPLICLICGDVARGINFDVMTCMSCKTFFRRHAKKLENNLQCQFEKNCQITQRTRGICSACRLKKCFAFGMDPRLVGNRFQNQIKSKHTQDLKMIIKKKNELPEPLSLSLLRNDRSTLTTSEWNLLSNILHAYDAANMIPQAKYLLEQQSLLPPKIRSKPSVTLDIIKFFYSTLQPFVERSPHFHDLSTETCRALVQHNSSTFGTLNSIFILREVNALSYPAFLTGCDIIYGYENMKYFSGQAIELNQNAIFIKIMLLILAFSTNCSIANPGDSENINPMSSTVPIINIQNIFITMFWKYLTYQYGFLDAVRWFNSFIKFVLRVLRNTAQQTNEQHSDMIDTVVEETTRSLTIED